MNTNTRKKQIKPKVTIDQDEVSTSKSKVSSKRFILSRIKLNRNLYIGIGLVLVVLLPSYFFFKSNLNLTNFTIFKNNVISEQNKKIDKIETQLSNNNQLLLDLEKKDQTLIRLESQIVKLSEMLKMISEKNDIISDKNDQLMKYIDNETKKKITLQESALDYEEEINVNDIQLVDSAINSETLAKEPKKKISGSQVPNLPDNSVDESNKKNIVSVVINRIEKNVANKEDFRNEVDLLATIGTDSEIINNLMKLSDKPISTPNEIVNQLELLLEEDIILYKGESGIKSKIFGILENQVSITKKNKSPGDVVIQEIKASIYNDNLDEVVETIKELNFKEDAKALLQNINNRTLYLNEMKYLKEKYDLS